MGILDHLYQWATSGDKDAPGASLIASGYTAGSQPLHGNFNHIINEIREKINEVISDGPIAHKGDVSMAPVYRRCYWPSDDTAWSLPHESSNYIDYIATAVAYVGIEPYINAAGERKIITLDGATATATRTFHIFDVATMAHESSSGDLASDLPSGSSEDWVPVSFCTDGTSVYGYFRNQNLAPADTYRMQAWDIATWTKKAAWPADGRPIVGTTSATTYGYGMVRQISDTEIGFCKPWAAGIQNRIEVMDMYDGAYPYGGGNGDGTNTEHAVALTSDGTYVYYVTYEGTVCSATIGAMTTGIGATGNYPGGPYVGAGVDIICIGNLIVSTYDSAGSMIRVSTSNEVDTAYVSATANNYKLNKSGMMVYDGMYLWVRGERDVPGSTTGCIAKIDLTSAVYGTAQTHIGDEDDIVITTIPIHHDYSSVGYNRASWLSSPICFDGRDVWVVCDKRPAQTLSSRIARITRAVIR